MCLFLQVKQIIWIVMLFLKLIMLVKEFIQKDWKIVKSYLMI